MSRSTDSAARGLGNSELPPQEGQEIEDQLTQEQLDEELQNDVDVMLTQEDVHEEEAREAVEGEEEEDEDESSSSGGYVSPEDPHPTEPRRRPTEDELDPDFDMTSEVGIQAFASCIIC
jgi:hypothetical protein